MSGLVNISLDDHEVQRTFAKLARKMEDMTPLMEGIGELGVTSIMRNFAEGGRPNKWKISQRVKKKGGKTLIKSQRLMRSVDHFKVMLGGRGVQWGTNVPYAAAQHFGGIGVPMMAKVAAHMRRVRSRDVQGKLKGVAGVREHSRMQVMNLPARPFLMLQDEDWVGILALGKKYLAEANQ